MIVERLFTRRSEVKIPSYGVPTSREFSAIEENAIYYAAGYVIRKILYRHVKKDDAKSKSIVTALISMLGNHYDNMEEQSSYMDYVTTWTKIADRGGLKHVTLDTFRFFSSVEIVTGDLLDKGCNKAEITGQAFINENVRFYWDLIADFQNESDSLQLLQEAINLWHTIRGFSVASKLFEDYKKAAKTNVGGKKGTRKELH